MSTLVWIAVAWTVTLMAATPEPTRELKPTDVSPGLTGFLATFAIVIVTVLLIIDMSRRVRRLRFRQRAAQEAAEKAAALQTGQDPDPDDPRD